MYWNKWYYKTIVLNIGLRMRPPGPAATVRAPDRSARNRPLAAARLGPPAADTPENSSQIGLDIAPCFTRTDPRDIILVI